MARIDQLRARQDELVNEYPELKPRGPKRRPDQSDQPAPARRRTGLGS